MGRIECHLPKQLLIACLMSQSICGGNVTIAEFAGDATSCHVVFNHWADMEQAEELRPLLVAVSSALDDCSAAFEILVSAYRRRPKECANNDVFNWEMYFFQTYYKLNIYIRFSFFIYCILYK